MMGRLRPFCIRCSPRAGARRHSTRRTRSPLPTLMPFSRPRGGPLRRGTHSPRAFTTGRRADPPPPRLPRHLTGSSAAWAPSASLLVANLCHRYVEGTDWEYSEFAHYDLGQAVAHLTFQAQALGLHARQFRAFDRAPLAAGFTVPQHWEITTMSAFGRLSPGLANI